MKKLGVILLTLMLAFTFTACSESAKSPATADVMKSIKSSIDFPEMAEIDKGNISAYYDLKAEDISECSYIIAGSGMTADEVLIIKLTSEDSAKKVVELMKGRRDQIKNTAADYTPSEIEKLDTAVIGQKGAYAYYAVTNNNTKAKEIINNAF